ncbi:hypothetical protein LTR56_005020 [Elasticomyces elasticus]|nr:hypothetical protein LTR22_022319 [Elasticomyces elasticus]KAK3652726.1 hypothetical protein LTR56_005020 [Elasticomyces elasticus]KAK4908367.1 hypothetical protein LTR49_022725 [Elasticomyces elasticus]KAK5748407.1 hypothetical protein LTS12_021535 [Elasticomyces elasticus]
MPSSLDNQKELLQRAIAAEESWDLDLLISLRTSDATHQLLPKTLDWPELDNAGVKEHMGRLAPVFKGGDYKIEIYSTVHDAEAHQASVYCMQTATTATPAGDFAMETVWLFSFTEDGTKITSVKEFVDSGYLTGWLAKLQG